METLTVPGDIVFVESNRWCPVCHKQMTVRTVEEIASGPRPGTKDTLIFWNCPNHKEAE